MATTKSLDQAVADLLDRQAATKPSAGRGWEPVDLSGVLTGTNLIDPPSVLTRDDDVPMLYPGRVNAFFGEPESLKTFLALLGAAQELGRGKHVVYADYEDAERSAVERLRALGTKDEDILSSFSYFGSPHPLLDDKEELLLSELIDQKGPVTLAVFDGVTAAMAAGGLNPNEGTDVTGFYGAAPRWFADNGAAVLLLDHVPKDKTGRGRWAIGSERKLSGLDGVAYTLKVVKPFGRGNRRGKVQVTIAKDRPGYVSEHEGQGRAVATFEPQSTPDGRIEPYLLPPEEAGENGSFRPTTLMERVSRTLEDAAKPLSASQVRQRTTGNNQYIGKALDRLVEEGYVESRSGSRNSTLYSLIKSYPDPTSRPGDFFDDDDEEDVDDMIIRAGSAAPVLSGSPLKGGGTRNQANRPAPGTTGNQSGTSSEKGGGAKTKPLQVTKKQPGRDRTAPRTVDDDPIGQDSNSDVAGGSRDANAGPAETRQPNKAADVGLKPGLRRPPLRDRGPGR